MISLEAVFGKEQMFVWEQLQLKKINTQKN
jgi:hypothetical protein